jgi:hypothetical protein
MLALLLGALERRPQMAAEVELDGNAPVKRIVSLTEPTGSVRPPLARMAFWRLISHLSLNYLSLVEGGRGAFIATVYPDEQDNAIKIVSGYIDTVAQDDGLQSLPRVPAVSVKFRRKR